MSSLEGEGEGLDVDFDVVVTFIQTSDVRTDDRVFDVIFTKSLFDGFKKKGFLGIRRVGSNIINTGVASNAVSTSDETPGEGVSFNSLSCACCNSCNGVHDKGEIFRGTRLQETSDVSALEFDSIEDFGFVNENRGEHNTRVVAGGDEDDGGEDE